MLTASVVTYNNEDQIEDTLISFMRAMPNGVDYKMWIIDNMSADGTQKIVERVTKGSEACRVILNDTNRGYGGGHNQAISQADGKYHIICNPDIIVSQDAIDKMCRYMDEHEDIGVLVPRLLNPDETLQHQNRREPTVFDLFLRRFAPRAVKRLFARRMDRYEMKDVGYDEICEVPCVSGAFMFCRTSALKRIAGFDEGYHLYFEDYDMTRRLNQAGYRAIYYPHAHAVHLWGRAAHKNLKMALVFAKSGMRYFNKWGWRFY